MAATLRAAGGEARMRLWRSGPRRTCRATHHPKGVESLPGGFLPGGMDGRATFAGRGDKTVAAGSSFVARASESAKEKKVIIQIKTCKGKHVTLVVSKGKGKAN